MHVATTAVVIAAAAAAAAAEAAARKIKITNLTEWFRGLTGHQKNYLEFDRMVSGASEPTKKNYLEFDRMVSGASEPPEKIILNLTEWFRGLPS